MRRIALSGLLAAAVFEALPEGGYRVSSGTETVTWRRGAPGFEGQLARREPSRAAKLVRALLERLERGAPPAKKPDEKALESLRKLGYLGK